MISGGSMNRKYELALKQKLTFFTYSVILGSMFPIHKRFPSWAVLSEIIEAFSTVSAADDMWNLWDKRSKRQSF